VAPTPVELRDTAVQVAHLAGRILADRFEGERTIEYKGGIDLVTDADRAAEAAILGLLGQRHPDHAVLAEESGAHTGSGYRWIIDPLDGTTNYSHRVPHFAVSIGVEDEQGLAAGVVYDPMRKETFCAARGEGATLNGRPLRLGTVRTLEEALLCTGFPYDVRENPEGPLGLFNRLVRHARGIRRMGSAALDLAYLAAGRFDGFFEFGLRPWDLAAGALLVTEAGGRMTRIDGAPLELGRGDVLAAAPGLYDPLLAHTRALLAEVGWS
jgi:myo-inositol-1(or 4)-monophosphatase